MLRVPNARILQSILYSGQGVTLLLVVPALVISVLAGVGEIGECDVVLRLFGEIADGSAAAERQRARRVRGSAQGA